MKRFALGLVLLLVLTGVIASFPQIRAASASGTIYIRADGSIDPPTANITSADNTTYTFTGDNYGEIDVERDNIVVDGKGCILSVGYSNFGINQYDRNNVTIKNMKIEGVWFSAGIHLMRSSNCTISGNNITADAPTQPYGIHLENSSDNKIFDNALANDGLFVAFSYQNTVENNTVNGKPLVYLEGVSDNAVNDAGEVVLVRCNNVTVKDLNFNNTTVGVELFETNNTTISGNDIAENNLGIVLEGSSNNTIDKNNMAENSVGIWLEGNRAHESSNNTVSGNHIAGGGHPGIAGNNDIGISLRSSSNSNNISGNNIEENMDGIVLQTSNYNHVSGNNITNNVEDGIVVSQCSNTTISGNSILNNNGRGVLLDTSSYLSYNTVFGNSIAYNGADGLCVIVFDDCNNQIFDNNITSNNVGIRFVPLHGAPNNTVYHNNFINNTLQVNLTGAISSIKWDDGYPSGGNYWSSYNGTDANHDGIGDTAYVIDANNTDNRPLVTPYVIPEFPSFLILVLFMIATLMAAIVYRRRQRAPYHSSPRTDFSLAEAHV